MNSGEECDANGGEGLHLHFTLRRTKRKKADGKKAARQSGGRRAEIIGLSAKIEQSKKNFQKFLINSFRQSTTFP